MDEEPREVQGEDDDGMRVDEAAASGVGVAARKPRTDRTSDSSSPSGLRRQDTK